MISFQSTCWWGSLCQQQCNNFLSQSSHDQEAHVFGLIEIDGSSTHDVLEKEFG
jgi:hypothetical protein